MGSSRQDVEFRSHGAALRGWLYPAAPGAAGAATGAGAAGGPRPGVVMAHGFSAVKEMFLDRYAEAFAEAGLTTLVYDHFGFGASDGEPRQSTAPSVQLEGYRDAIAWLGRQPTVDAARIGIWGSSFSGGEVILLAAEDLPIRAAVAQVPGLGDGGPELPAGALAAMTEAFEQGRADAMIPAVTDRPDGNGVMFEDGAHAWFTRVAAERAPSWRNEVLAAGLAESFRPIDHLADAKVPLLLVVAPADTLTPPGPGLEVAAAVRNIEVVEIPGGHFDAYETGFEASAGPAIEWFGRRL